MKSSSRLQFWKKNLILYFLKTYKEKKEARESILSNEPDDFFFVLSRELPKNMDMTKNRKKEKHNLKFIKRKSVVVSYFLNDLIKKREDENRNPVVIIT